MPSHPSGETAAKVCFGRDGGQAQDILVEDLEYVATCLRITGQSDDKGSAALWTMPSGFDCDSGVGCRGTRRRQRPAAGQAHQPAHQALGPPHRHGRHHRRRRRRLRGGQGGRPHQLAAPAAAWSASRPTRPTLPTTPTSTRRARRSPRVSFSRLSRLLTQSKRGRRPLPALASALPVRDTVTAALVSVVPSP